MKIGKRLKHIRGKPRYWLPVSVVLAMLLLLIPLAALADVAFTQSYSAQGNYAIVADGVGLTGSSTGDITLNVPGTPIQAFLYWAGNDILTGGDDTVNLSVNGGPAVSLTADTQYGPEFWFGTVHNYVYVEDVTALVLTGTNTYTVSGFDGGFTFRYGAGLIVVYEDPALPITDVEIREGLDSAYHGFPAPRGPNSEVTCFQFSASASVRTLDYTLFVGGIDTSSLRPNAIWYQTGSGALPTALVNQIGATEIGSQPMNSNDGDEWDTYTNSLTVSAGDTFACFQLESINDVEGLDGASFIWLAGGVSITSAAPAPTPTPTASPASPDPDLELPDTGFAPGRLTRLPLQSTVSRYKKMAGLDLEIPSLGVEIPILGVPKLEDGWDVTWLSNQAGYLEGTAFPTWSGNTALTAHVYLSDGTPGPFARLSDLRWGDEIIINAFGQRYVYEVRRLQYVTPDNLSVLDHEDSDWVTLLTCAVYDQDQDRYRWRVAVQAVLMRFEDL